MGRVLCVPLYAWSKTAMSATTPPQDNQPSPGDTPATRADTFLSPPTASPSDAGMPMDARDWEAVHAGRRPEVPGYEIFGELGRGGMGVVYKARQVALDRLVALKMILTGDRASAADRLRFRTEAEAVGRLNHPNIVQIYEVGQHDGLPFFSLEFCAGGSLDRKLNGASLPTREAAALVETLARTVQAAHDQGILHRDLKPANVLLASGACVGASGACQRPGAPPGSSLTLLALYTPKITDLGLAKRLDQVGQTSSGAVLGTPCYMAPEQAAGQSKDVGFPADIYALGAILYECLTGRPPFRATTAFETLTQVVREEPVPPRRRNAKVPADLEAVCLKCLEKDPKKRYARAGELADDLRRFQQGEPVRAKPASFRKRILRWGRRRLWTGAAVAGAVLALFFGLLLGGKLSKNSDKEPKPPPTPPASGRLYALLVGCTRYDNLGKEYWLEGPANDVQLMRRLLQDWPGFKTRTIVTLSEEEGVRQARLRPTRANVERAFAELAGKAGSGDQVAVLLAGHGSQAPDRIFLPADAGKGDGVRKSVTQAIHERELRRWLKAIADRNVSVWITVDAGFSGTATRTADGPPGLEVARGIHPRALGIPEANLRKVREEVGTRPGLTPFEVPGDGSLVALFACRATEPAVETVLPYDSGSNKRHGLMTYTLCQVLKRAGQPLTYRETVQQVQAQYDVWGRTAPAPLLAGPDSDRAVLATKQWPARPAIELSRDKPDGTLRIGTGALRGLTADSVLAVYQPPGTRDSDPLLGHVRVAKRDALKASVIPCAYGGVPAPTNLQSGRCEVVAVGYAGWRLKLAMHPRTAADLRERLRKGLMTLRQARPGLVEVVEDAARAEWLVRLDRDKVYLESTRLASGEPGHVGNAADDKQLADSLQRMCLALARVRTLLGLVNASEEERAVGSPVVDVAVELIRYAGKSDRTGTVVPWRNGGRSLKAGDLIAFRLTNPGRVAVDVTLLFVDAGAGIQAFFPEGRGGAEDNRLFPGQTFTTPRGRVTGDPPGRDRMVVIAVKAGGQPIDLSGLAQPSLARARNVSRGQQDSPLGKLLEGAFYEDRLRGGLKDSGLDTYTVRLLCWETIP